jgi:hypothetical protein
MGRADHGREDARRNARRNATEAARAADRAEAEAWSIRMEGYGGPAQPSPTIGQCLNGGYSWLEIECCRCKTRASMPLDAIRRARDTAIWKLEASFRCRSCGTRRYKPPVRMIKLTERQEITPCKWVHRMRSGDGRLLKFQLRTMRLPRCSGNKHTAPARNWSRCMSGFRPQWRLRSRRAAAQRCSRGSGSMRALKPVQVQIQASSPGASARRPYKKFR